MTPEQLDAEPAGPTDPRVEAAVARHAELAETSPHDHVEIYEDVHRTLQEVLADASTGDHRTEETGDADR
jgi:hypothetical protein